MCTSYLMSSVNNSRNPNRAHLMTTGHNFCKGCPLFGGLNSCSRKFCPLLGGLVHSLSKGCPRTSPQSVLIIAMKSDICV